MTENLRFFLFFFKRFFGNSWPLFNSLSNLFTQQERGAERVGDDEVQRALSQDSNLGRLC